MSYDLTVQIKPLQYNYIVVPIGLKLLWGPILLFYYKYNILYTSIYFCEIIFYYYVIFYLLFNDLIMFCLHF